MKFHPLFILAVLVFLHEAAFGKTVQIDQANMKFEIPDDFIQTDMGYQNAVYTAVRTLRSGEKEVICVTMWGGDEDIQDPSVMTETTQGLEDEGYNVQSSQVIDVIGDKFLYTEVVGERVSEAHFDISNENNHLVISFKEMPCVNGPVAGDPMVMKVMDSFLFLHPRHFNAGLAIFIKFIKIILMCVGIGSLALLKFIQYGRWVNAPRHDSGLFGWLNRRDPE